MAKILVTGGAGFIGSNLTQELVKQGHQVTVYDNLRSGKLENLAGIPHRFIKGDVRDYQLLRSVTEGFDFIFHLAALTSVIESMSKIDECVSININGTINVLKAAREHKIQKVIFASSAAVYGDTPELPKNELMRISPKSPYAITKADGENFCRLYSNYFGTPTVCARFFNAFGEKKDPESDYAAVISIIIHKAITGQPLIIYGDGTQTRDYIYVKDVVKALILLMQKGDGIYNVGYGNVVDLNTIIALVQEITKTKINVRYSKVREGDIKHSFASIDKLEALGFKPDYTLEEGIRRTINYLKKQDLLKRNLKCLKGNGDYLRERKNTG